MNITIQHKEIYQYFQNRIKNNESLPSPSNMDVFFWGNEKNINVYIDILISHSALIKTSDSEYLYDKIVIINTNLDVNIKKIKGRYDPIIKDSITLEFITASHYDISELENIISSMENTFIIVLNTEKYLPSVFDPKLTQILNGRKLTDFELKYLNIANTILSFENKIGSNFIVFDTQLYMLDFDFLKPLNDIDVLSICGFTNSLIEEEQDIKLKIQNMIDNNAIAELIEYINNLDGIDHKDFLRLQVYSQLMDERGYFKKEIDSIFESMDIDNLSLHHYLKLAEISKKSYTKETTIDLLEQALALTDDYFYLAKISDLSKCLSNELHFNITRKIVSLFPESDKAKLYELNELVENKQYEDAYTFSLNNGFEQKLIDYILYLKENISVLDTSPCVFFTKAIGSVHDRYLISLFYITKEQLLSKGKYVELYSLILNNRNYFNNAFIYSQLVSLAKILLSKPHEEIETYFDLLSNILEHIFDLTKTDDQSITIVKDKLAELIDYANNYGYGFAFIINYIYSRFVNGKFKLIDVDEIDRNGITTDIETLKEKTEFICNDIFSTGVLMVGEYHVFKPNIIPKQNIVDDLVRLQFYGTLDNLRQSSNPIDEELETLNYAFLLIHNLARFSSFENSDLHFLRVALSTMTLKHNSQQIRDYLQYLLFIPQTLERKKLGLLGYADVSHRMNDTEEALTCLALSIEDGQITANSYYLTGILTVRILRELSFYDKALNVLEVVERNIGKFNKDILVSVENEIESLRLAITFKVCIRQVDNDITKLAELLPKLIEFYKSELKLNRDIKPSLTLAIQAYRMLQSKGFNTKEFDDFFSKINSNNSKLPDILSALIHDNFNSIFNLYLKQKERYSEKSSEDFTKLKTLARMYLNNIKGKNKYELLFCMEILTEHGIKDKYSHKIDVPVQSFATIEDYVTSINNLVEDTDIIYLSLNQINQLIVAKVSENGIKVEQSDTFNIDEFTEWNKIFPKEYGFYDANEEPNLFYDSMNFLDINIDITRNTTFVFDTQLHSLTPNLFLEDGKFIGSKRPIATVPSITWLNYIVNLDENQEKTSLKAWISDADTEGWTLKTIIDRYIDNDTFKNYNIQLDTSHYFLSDFQSSKLAMITAHGGTTGKSNYFSSVSDEGDLKLHYQDFAQNLRNCDVVILFVCNAGRFNNHPYLSTTISLQKELLKNGCETIIASPWPLDAMMTPKWFRYFLQKWIDEALTVSEAVFQTNTYFYNENFEAEKYLALNVFGNPFKKY
tara:strand:+ start:113 stop:3868 length:3756 start_codon:yes stop_codon:yes gene_type:complete